MEKNLPLLLREGAGGRGMSHEYYVKPLPPTLSRKGGEEFSPVPTSANAAAPAIAAQKAQTHTQNPKTKKSSHAKAKKKPAAARVS